MAEIYHLAEGYGHIVFSSHREVQQLYDATLAEELGHVLEVIGETKGNMVQCIDCNPLQLVAYLELMKELHMFCVEISGDGEALRFGNERNAFAQREDCPN